MFKPVVLNLSWFVPPLSQDP